MKEEAVTVMSLLLSAEREDVMDSYIAIWYCPLVMPWDLIITRTR